MDAVQDLKFYWCVAKKRVVTVEKSIVAGAMSRQNDVPSDPVDRRDWVKNQLVRRGTSMRQIALRIGVCPQAVAQALMLPSHRIELALAEALELPVHALFPERYRADGFRLVRTRTPSERAAA